MIATGFFSADEDDGADILIAMGTTQEEADGGRK
jgi:hypothetical protein